MTANIPLGIESKRHGSPPLPSIYISVSNIFRPAIAAVLSNKIRAYNILFPPKYSIGEVWHLLTYFSVGYSY
jgi:hypothetical protein